MSYDKSGELRCDMTADCDQDVTYLDRKGYVYCTLHGLVRQGYQPCRKLRPWELNRLRSGRPLNRY